MQRPMHFYNPERGNKNALIYSEAHIEETFQKNATEDSLVSFLVKKRWKRGVGYCPQCGPIRISKSKKQKIVSGMLLCSKCKRRVAILSGTLFHGTHKSVKKWFKAIWLMATAEQGLTAYRLQKELGLGSYKTAWRWLRKLRRALPEIRWQKNSGIVVVGSTEIEVFPKKRSKRQRVRILIVARKRHNRIHFVNIVRVNGPSESEIIAALSKFAVKEDIVQTDERKEYKCIKRHGYRHEALSSKSRGKIRYFGIRGVERNLVRWWKQVYRGAADVKYIDEYLREFELRYNFRKIRPRGQIFYWMIGKGLTSRFE
ncbi:MAG: IS1595 family transposase [bacterium]